MELEGETRVGIVPGSVKKLLKAQLLQKPYSGYQA